MRVPHKTTNPVGRPLNDSAAASGHIHLRVVMARKNWYVRMARLHNLTLAEWMQRVCDEESGYPPKSQLVTANATMTDCEDQAALARLFAAAPELLAALEFFVTREGGDLPPYMNPAILKAKNAIAKAKGTP